MRKHFEKGLAASPHELAKVFDEDLREFFEKLYSKPELTDPSLASFLPHSSLSHGTKTHVDVPWRIHARG